MDIYKGKFKDKHRYFNNLLLITYSTSIIEIVFKVAKIITLDNKF